MEFINFRIVTNAKTISLNNEFQEFETIKQKITMYVTCKFYSAYLICSKQETSQKYFINV